MMHLIYSMNYDWIEVFYHLIWYHDILFGHDRCFGPTWQFSIKVFFVEPWLSDNQTDPFSNVTLNANFFLHFLITYSFLNELILLFLYVQAQHQIEKAMIWFSMCCHNENGNQSLSLWKWIFFPLIFQFSILYLDYRWCWSQLRPHPKSRYINFL